MKIVKRNSRKIARPEAITLLKGSPQMRDKTTGKIKPPSVRG